MALSTNITINKNLLLDIAKKSQFRSCRNIRLINNWTFFQRTHSNSCDGKQEQPLRCRVALITGGCSEVGYQISEQFLKAGAKAVILSDITEEECYNATENLNKIFGPEKALYQPCDVRKKEEMEKVFKCIIKRFGRIDIVVNNASIMAEKNWEDTIATNIQGLVHATLLGFQYMSPKNCGYGGIIVNKSSIFGLQPFHSTPVYTGTKHFIIAFTRSMGHDYFFKQSEVKVMAFCPGITKTKNPFNADHGQLGQFDQLGDEAEKALKCFPSQGPEICGKCIMEMIKSGENGSVWVNEGCEIYKVSIPDRQSLKPKKKDVCANKKKTSSDSSKDICKSVSDSHKTTNDSPKKDQPKEGESKAKAESHKPKQDLCKPKDVHSKRKEDPCKPKSEECKPKDNPCTGTPKEDPCKSAKGRKTEPTSGKGDKK